MIRCVGESGCWRLMAIAVVVRGCFLSGVEAFVPTACAPVQHMLTSSHDAFPTARSRASCQRSRETIGAFCPVGVNSYGQHSAYVVGATARRWPDARGTRRRTRSASLRMITLEVVQDSEIPEMADFFVSNFWEEEVGPSQKRPLVRELVADYRNRYGALVGKRKRPSLLVAARGASDEIVGCVAIEVSVCVGERIGLKARGINPNSPNAELRPVLANLAVARSARRRGLAKRLVKRCEDAAKEWGYDEVLLLVEENNKKARRLYQKLGYRILFKDYEAKKIVPGDHVIRDVPCVNVCMRRELNANIFAGLFKILAR